MFPPTQLSNTFTRSLFIVVCNKRNGFNLIYFGSFHGYRIEIIKDEVDGIKYVEYLSD